MAKKAIGLEGKLPNVHNALNSNFRLFACKKEKKFEKHLNRYR